MTEKNRTAVRVIGHDSGNRKLVDGYFSQGRYARAIQSSGVSSVILYFRAGRPGCGVFSLLTVDQIRIGQSRRTAQEFRENCSVRRRPTEEDFMVNGIHRG